MIKFILLATFAVVAKAAFFRGQLGPLDVCEREEQLIADKGSCTRYHRCRKVENLNVYTTDIAICAQNQVFDMISSECVDADTPFLQDPESCNTFYGCHPTKETSEGFVRSHYQCPGDLRFHPHAKFCTFKTDVTDNLCNSQDPDQRIIGNFNLDDATDLGLLPSRRFSRPSPFPNNRRYNNDLLRSSYETNFPPLKLRSSEIIEEIESPPPKKPTSAEASLDRIAQVISGQLLTLQNNQPRKIDNKE